MVAAYEFMYVTPGIQNLIRENKSFRIDSEIQTGKRFGMQLLDDNLFTLFTAGKISAEECIDKARNPGQMMDKMAKAGHDVEKQDDGLAAEAAEVAATASTPGAAKPGAGPTEAERQAQIAANRARMQAMQNKK
jgi:Tfp pilus assembly ATPase PilU